MTSKVGASPVTQLMNPVYELEEVALLNCNLLKAVEKIQEIIKSHPVFSEEGQIAIGRLKNHIETNRFYVTRRRTADPYYSPMQCTRMKDYEGLRYLVRVGEDINTLDSTGHAPIHVAAAKNDLNAYNILRIHPSFDPKLMSKHLKTPSMLATDSSLKSQLEQR